MYYFTPELVYLFVCSFFRFKFVRKKEIPSKFKHYYSECFHFWFYPSYVILAKLGLFDFIRKSF